jgi:DNA-binding transcriptional LysR family regulator
MGSQKWITELCLTGTTCGIFLAVARGGSTHAAAKSLGTSQSTVQRRITELEARIGRPLVARHKMGYRLTELGEHLLPYAERAEEAMTTFERQSLASEKDLIGKIRVTCTSTVADRLLKSPFIDTFHARYPGLQVELVITDRILDLSKGEADLAIRLGQPRDEALVGRKVANVPRAIYASRSYVERHGRLKRLEDIAHHCLVTCDGEIANSAPARWLRSMAPQAAVGARSDNMPGLVLALKSGCGLGLLPVHMGDWQRELVRLIDAGPELMTHFWLLMHRDMQRTPRVRAFFDFAIAEIKAFRALLLDPIERSKPKVEKSPIEQH